jgi:transcription initiation factor IIE alpha subunit
LLAQAQSSVMESLAKYEVKMNFNHLMDARFLKRRCGNRSTGCYYVPAGNVRSTQGENVHMTMVCRNCGKREDIFLSKQQYQIQEKLIQKELGDV